MRSFLAILVLAAAIAWAVPRVAPGLLEAYLHGDAARPIVAVAKEVGPANGRKVAIDSDPQGHYVTDAIINGHAITVMVDTGATTVALSAATARRLGFKLTAADYSAPVATANGTVDAARVTLSEIRLGSISVRDVAAIVVPGDALELNLLGMSFLNRLRKFEAGGGQLVLVQ